MERYIGGEFWYDEVFTCAERQIDGGKAYFLNGGQASLQVICDYLEDHGIRDILLPAYLCPTIVDSFEQNNLNCGFYRIKKDFSIDLEDLKSKLFNKKAVFFINYFGFLHSKETLDFLTDIRNSGVVLIEDNVQSVLNKNIIGNFAFNSFRKFVPYDGSYLYSDYNLDKYIEKYKSVENTRIPLVRQARSLKRDYICGDLKAETLYLEKFNLAERAYYTDRAVLGDSDEQNCIERVDWKKVISVRRWNYNYLSGFIENSGNDYLEMIFPRSGYRDYPIGLPVYVKNKKRDELRKKLYQHGIFLPVHWDIGKDTRLNQMVESLRISEDILTLIIDQRYGEEDIYRMMKYIYKFLGDKS